MFGSQLGIGDVSFRDIPFECKLKPATNKQTATSVEHLHAGYKSSVFVGSPLEPKDSFGLSGLVSHVLCMRVVIR